MVSSPVSSASGETLSHGYCHPSLMDTVPQFVLDAVRKAAEKCGFHGEDLVIRIEPCNSQDGFIGQLFRATLKQQGSPDKSLICKIPPLCAARREQFDASPMFEREPWFYERILPEFERYQREKGVDRRDGFTAYAKSYVAYYESMDQGTVLVMEDLGRRGFRMYNKLLPLDCGHMELAMVQLGRFHAISFAMKRDQPEVYESLQVPNAIVEMFEKNRYCQFLVSESLKLALEIPGLNETEREVLNKLKDNVLTELVECLDVGKAEPYSAIIHGDCWINNCMFSYEEVESLDEENARVVVRFSIGGGQESLNEYLLQLVSNAEYKKYSKVLNNAKYEEFKNRTTDSKPTIKEERSSTDRKLIKREPSASPSPPPRPSSSSTKSQQPSRSHRDYYDQPAQQRTNRRDRSPDTRADDDRDDRRQQQQQRHRRDREESDRRERRRSRSRERQRHRQVSSSSDDDDDDSDDSVDRDRHQHQRRHKSSSSGSYARTSSGTKKKSHKYKQRRDHSRERDRDRDRGRSSDEEDDRHHKKKTKKSKKQRSRSRSRR